jgi:hypothetical protein
VEVAELTTAALAVPVKQIKPKNTKARSKVALKYFVRNNPLIWFY